VLLGFIIEAVVLSPANHVAAGVVILAAIYMFIIQPDLILDRRP
jgi:hypothetical protein